MTCCQNVSIRHHVFAFKDTMHISHPGALCPSFCLSVRPCTCQSVDVLVHFSRLFPAEHIATSLTENLHKKNRNCASFSTATRFDPTAEEEGTKRWHNEMRACDFFLELFTGRLGVTPRFLLLVRHGDQSRSTGVRQCSFQTNLHL